MIPENNSSSFFLTTHDFPRFIFNTYSNISHSDRNILNESIILWFNIFTGDWSSSYVDSQKKLNTVLLLIHIIIKNHLEPGFYQVVIMSYLRQVIIIPHLYPSLILLYRLYNAINWIKRFFKKFIAIKICHTNSHLNSTHYILLLKFLILSYIYIFFINKIILL